MQPTMLQGHDVLPEMPRSAVLIVCLAYHLAKYAQKTKTRSVQKAAKSCTEVQKKCRAQGFMEG